MKPLSHGLTLAASTGFGGVGSRSSQLSVQGPQHGSLGKVGAGATAPPPFQARPTKGAGSEHPRTLKSRSGPSPPVKTARQVAWNGSAQPPGRWNAEVSSRSKGASERSKSLSDTSQAPAFLAHVSALWRLPGPHDGPRNAGSYCHLGSWKQLWGVKEAACGLRAGRRPRLAPGLASLAPPDGGQPANIARLSPEPPFGAGQATDAQS